MPLRWDLVSSRTAAGQGPAARRSRRRLRIGPGRAAAAWRSDRLGGACEAEEVLANGASWREDDKDAGPLGLDGKGVRVPARHEGDRPSRDDVVWPAVDVHADLSVKELEGLVRVGVHVERVALPRGIRTSNMTSAVSLLTGCLERQEATIVVEMLAILVGEKKWIRVFMVVNLRG